MRANRHSLPVHGVLTLLLCSSLSVVQPGNSQSSRISLPHGSGDHSDQRKRQTGRPRVGTFTGHDRSFRKDGTQVHTPGQVAMARHAPGLDPQTRQAEEGLTRVQRVPEQSKNLLFHQQTICYCLFTMPRTPVCEGISPCGKLNAC